MIRTHETEMVMRTILAILLSLVLVGCVTSTQISTGLDSMMNKPIGYVVDKLGFPDRESTVGGTKAYTWIRSKDVNGILYGQNGSVSSLHSTHQCRLDVTVNENDIVTWFRWDGEVRVCNEFAKHVSNS